MPRTLGAALAAGAASFLQGQQEAEQRAWERERVRRLEERQKQDAERAEQLRQLQMEQIRAAMTQATKEQTQREDDRMNAALQGGYRPAAQMQQVGDVLERAGFAPTGPRQPGLRVNGQELFKMFPTAAEQQARRQQGAAQAAAKVLGLDPSVAWDYESVMDLLKEREKAKLKPNEPQYDSGRGVLVDKTTGTFRPIPGLPPLPNTYTPVFDASGTPYVVGNRTGTLTPAPISGAPTAPAPTGGSSTGGSPTGSVMGGAPARTPAASGAAPSEPTPRPQPPRFGPAAAKAAEAQQTFTTAVTEAQQLAALLGQYRTQLGQAGVRAFAVGSPEHTALQSLQRQILMTLKGDAFFKLGVLAGPDMAVMEDILNPPTGLRAMGIGTQGIIRQIDQLGANLNTNLGIQARQLGVDPPQVWDARQFARQQADTLAARFRTDSTARRTP